MQAITYKSDGCTITLNKQGAKKYTRLSYPVHSGIFSEVETKEYILHFNLNNEIIRAKGKLRSWPHPHEWLKRTVGNDWIYYSTGGYTGVFEATGEYYLPNMPYLTNSMLGGNPFSQSPVTELIKSWPLTIKRVLEKHDDLPKEIDDFLHSTLFLNDELSIKSDTLFSTCGGRTTVLPPDTRHVDYNVIPLTISTGCLYKCRFCEVKNKKPFQIKQASMIDDQLEKLAALYARDTINYNSLFLGEHDALQSGPSHILNTLDKAYHTLGFANSYLHGCNAFSFGSVTSLLNCPDSFFADLQHLPYSVYINIGLESADQETLDRLGKPLAREMVYEAFRRMQEINDRYHKTEITANFVLGDDLPPNHISEFIKLVRDSLPRKKVKGCIYLSPLRFGEPSRAKTFDFNRLKVLSRLPTYLYIIQRL